jgi:hypothetical protein
MPEDCPSVSALRSYRNTIDYTYRNIVLWRDEDDVPIDVSFFP